MRSFRLVGLNVLLRPTGGFSNPTFLLIFFHPSPTLRVFESSALGTLNEVQTTNPTRRKAPPSTLGRIYSNRPPKKIKDGPSGSTRESRQWKHWQRIFAFFFANSRKSRRVLTQHLNLASTSIDRGRTSRSSASPKVVGEQCPLYARPWK